MRNSELISPQLPEPNGHFSHGILCASGGRLAFISGMTARSADGAVVGLGDIAVQTDQVCRNLMVALHEAGGSLADVVRLDVYVRDISDYDAIHQVRRRYFTQTRPASTLVEVSRLAHEDLLIEMSAVAVIT